MLCMYRNFSQAITPCISYLKNGEKVVCSMKKQVNDRFNPIRPSLLSISFGPAGGGGGGGGWNCSVTYVFII